VFGKRENWERKRERGMARRGKERVLRTCGLSIHKPLGKRKGKERGELG
jgi:hypothetical protein